MDLKYKEHPGLLEMVAMPELIRNEYYRIHYIDIDIKEFGKIPIPLFMLLTIETDISKSSNYTTHHGKDYTIDIDYTQIPIQEYARGFIEGYNSSLLPFIDTNESRKEMILREALKGFSSFTKHMGNESGMYSEPDFFKNGQYEGKRYKAWEIIFETPSIFIDPKTQNPLEITPDVISKIKDYAELFLNKFDGQSWSIGDVPEQAYQIVEIELSFKYMKQIIQDKINAANDKQSEINNFLSLCDIAKSEVIPKCKDPFENKEINEYWLSQYEALKIFVAAFERHIPKTSATETTSTKEPPATIETTEDKVRRILEPLTKKSEKYGTVILESKDFEILVMTYVNFIDYNKTPSRAERFVFHGSNPEFFTPLNALHKKLPLTIDGIGDVLTFVLSRNDRHGDRGKQMLPSTIEKNITKKGKY